MKLFNKMAQIIINNTKHIGSQININNGNITIDGKKITIDNDEKQINISVVGDISDLSVDSCEKIDIKGNVKKVKTSSGDIDITGDVLEDIQTSSGDIDISGNVNGNVQTSSGDVKCSGDIQGSVRTMSGNIKR